MGEAYFFYVAMGLFMAFANFMNSNAASEEEITYVVSPSRDSENFYLQLNSLMGVGSVSLNFSKDVICNAIFNSPSIPLKKDVEIIDDSIAENKMHSALFRPKNDWHLFKGPSNELLVNVSVLQTVREEAVFPCVVKVKETGKLKLYLVSGLYDFNHGRRALYYSHPTHCRFVFEFNESRNLASLVAVAEKPARVLFDPSTIEDLYHSRKAISERSRAICGFTTGRKLRICTVGLSGKAREGYEKITFLPLDDRIEPQCENITVTFGDWHRRQGLWAIGCKTEPSGKKEFFNTYYISLGSEPHEFFIIHQYFNLIGLFYSHLDEENSD